MKITYIGYKEKDFGVWEVFCNQYELYTMSNTLDNALEELKKCINDSQIPLINRKTDIIIPRDIESICSGNLIEKIQRRS